MKFGPVPPEDALGAIAAHSVRAGEQLIRKGGVLSAENIAALIAAGFSRIVVARLEEGDIGEDEAALRLARLIAGAGARLEAPFTGRVNLFAAHAGVLNLDPAAIDALNMVDEGITVATLPPFARVVAGQMIATVKIIPYGIATRLIARAEAAIAPGALALAPFRLSRIALIQTVTPGFAGKVLDKTRKVTEARLAAMGARLVGEWRVAHDEEALRAALAKAEAAAELTLVFAASAISDRRDVVPAAIEAAGGSIVHLGMPVDPGNLLLLGALLGKPIIGAPGCARSPKENGFDMVLARVAAGITLGHADLARLGVGGLLSEISTRPQPREGKLAPAPPRLAAVVLAAGRSSRFGEANKLLADFSGKPVVRHVAEALLGAGLPVTVVTGHQAGEVRQALSGLIVRFTHNEDFVSGMAGSLKTGIKALASDVDGALVALGDMPAISPALIKALIGKFSPPADGLIVAPSFAGRRGHPILWARRFFPELCAVEGDTGARHLLGAHQELVTDLPWSDDSVLVDVDTPQALAELAGRS